MAQTSFSKGISSQGYLLLQGHLHLRGHPLSQEGCSPPNLAEQGGSGTESWPQVTSDMEINDLERVWINMLGEKGQGKGCLQQTATLQQGLIASCFFKQPWPWCLIKSW